MAGVRYANGTSASDSYDPARGWLTAQDVTSADHGTVFDQTYTYDPAGTIVATSSDSSGQDLAYTYNTLDELTGVTNAATGKSTQTLQYDDLGNIVSNSTRRRLPLPGQPPVLRQRLHRPAGRPGRRRPHLHLRRRRRHPHRHGPTG